MLKDFGAEFETNVQGPNLPDHMNVNAEAIAASSMIRSHSVSGDLHGVQPDPIAADILRKEPEQETFARLQITPKGIDLIPFLSDAHSNRSPA